MFREKFISIIILSLLTFIIFFLVILLIFPSEYKDHLGLYTVVCFIPAFIYGNKISIHSKKLGRIFINGLIFIIIFSLFWTLISFTSADFIEEIIMGYLAAVIGYIVGVISKIKFKKMSKG